MSKEVNTCDKLWAALVRLYPSSFRQRYGEEALRLVMDRARDEKGFLRRSRLWLDLIRDLATTATLYGSESPVSQISRAPGGALSFQFVGRDSPSATSLLMGFLASLTLLAILPFGFGRSASDGKWSFPQEPVTSQTAPEINTAKRHELIQQIAANLKDHYVDSTAAEKMAESLQTNEINGVYKAIADGRAFASLLTQQLREVSQDLHIDVIYSDRPLPDGPPPPRSAAMLRQDCTFEKVEMLPNKISYLKFNFFPDTAGCKDAAEAALAELNDAQSVILDLRDNRGGFPDMVMLMASWFFDHPEYMYNPRENTTEQSWTRSPVPASNLAHKPLYILTSSRTISGAEHFSYNLKMLKRATLVGETTAGSTHSGVFHRLDDHFGLGIPEVRPINPYGKADWEGVGVEPDVKVKAADALTTTVALAQH